MKRNNTVSGINMFIKHIYDKVTFKHFNIFKRLSYNRKLKKFRSDILNGSPSFGVLWQMADFIKLAELIFFYNNSLKNTSGCLYSSKNYTSGQNGFIVFSNDIKITIKLFNDARRVILEIDRNKGDSIKTTMSFTNDTWDETPTMYDEMLLEQVIKIINSRIIALFDNCYESR